MRAPARISVDEDEVLIGPLIFEWDAINRGIQISKNEDEAVAYIENITTSQWEDFVYAALHPAAEVDQ